MGRLCEIVAPEHWNQATKMSSAFVRVPPLLDTNWALGGCDTRDDFPISDFRTYEYAYKNDDACRHRMLVNFLATIVRIVSIVTGSWLMDRIISSWP
jgi:hypothetical protein